MSTNQVQAPSPSTDIDREWETHTVSFPGFADLSTPKGSYVKSSKFICLGREWCLWIFPRSRGVEVEAAEEEKVSVYLSLRSAGKLKVEFSFTIKDLQTTIRIREFKPNDGVTGYRNLYTRDKIVARLVDGTLLVEVKLRHATSAPPFIPDNPATCNIVQKMFMDEEFTDITFEIGGEKLTTSSPTVFHAHRLILKMAAPQLEELCVKSDETPTRVQILDVSPDTFKALLLYIYGCKIPEFGNDISRTKDIIEAANKYGVTRLKLEAESHYVSSIKFNLENVVENLLFAETKNCALLKEKIMKFIVNNAVDIVEKETLKNFSGGGLLNDALTALAMKEKDKACRGNDNENSSMSTIPICELRRLAQEKGMDVDGTREMLISALNQVTK